GLIKVLAGRGIEICDAVARDVPAGDRDRAARNRGWPIDVRYLEGVAVRVASDDREPAFGIDQRRPRRQLEVGRRIDRNNVDRGRYGRAVDGPVIDQPLDGA